MEVDKQNSPGPNLHDIAMKAIMKGSNGSTPKSIDGEEVKISNPLSTANKQAARQAQQAIQASQSSAISQTSSKASREKVHSS